MFKRNLFLVLAALILPVFLINAENALSSAKKIGDKVAEAAWDRPPISGDLNGDGKDDIVICNRNGEVWAHLSTSSTISSAQKFGEKVALNSWDCDPMIGDMNGDKKDDIIVWNYKGEVWVLLSNGTALSSAQKFGEKVATNAWDRPPIVGDINGDGKADIIVCNREGEVWAHMSTGTAITSAKQFGEKVATSSWDYSPMTGDINGDKKDDLIVWNYKGEVWAHLSNGTAIASAQKVGDKVATNAKDRPPIVGDINGDGKDDIIVCNREGEVWVLFSSFAQ